jgi:hypothetical protein
MRQIWREKEFSRFYLRGSLSLALLALLIFSNLAVARADSETLDDPPRVQQANSYNIEYLSPGEQGQRVNDNVTFRFKVTDRAGQPVSGLNLDLTAIRNYSGQVTKEHNGPRTPDLGPVLLEPAGKPGEYQTTLKFGANGHWFLKLGGDSLKGETVQFRQPIEAAENAGAGVGLDWLLWIGLFVLVGVIVAVVRSGGEKFPVPVAELEMAQAEGGD